MKSNALMKDFMSDVFLVSGNPSSKRRANANPTVASPNPYIPLLVTIHRQMNCRALPWLRHSYASHTYCITTRPKGNKTRLPVVDLTATWHAMPLRWHWVRWHIPDLFDQKLSFVDELLVIGSILQKVRQECEQFFPVHE